MQEDCEQAAEDAEEADDDAGAPYDLHTRRLGVDVPAEMSQLKMAATASCSDDPLLITATTTWHANKKAPGGPNMCTATAGGTSPLLASAAVRGRSRALAASPMALAIANGMLNHASRPPIMNPHTAEEGVRQASAVCQ
eukprot:CAMPEP_0114160746 /NCGR_PEP_ID=MMETSP0043_2-20121206/28531_1 /TAXON_ID=464988 /ORGANISM="Hemiselmis andersenii, Strain CCMP644" /LENGTH=138 /DNA_ID=CAMNT_0001256825 /DNA_START=105 /DNA_END=522 /DNA_ORIENTATION=-